MNRLTVLFTTFFIALCISCGASKYEYNSDAPEGAEAERDGADAKKTKDNGDDDAGKKKSQKTSSDDADDANDTASGNGNTNDNANDNSADNSNTNANDNANDNSNVDPAEPFADPDGLGLQGFEDSQVAADLVNQGCAAAGCHGQTPINGETLDAANNETNRLILLGYLLGPDGAQDCDAAKLPTFLTGGNHLGGVKNLPDAAKMQTWFDVEPACAP